MWREPQLALADDVGCRQRSRIIWSHSKERVTCKAFFTLCCLNEILDGALELLTGVQRECDKVGGQGGACC